MGTLQIDMFPRQKLKPTWQVLISCRQDTEGAHPWLTEFDDFQTDSLYKVRFGPIMHAGVQITHRLRWFYLLFWTDGFPHHAMTFVELQIWRRQPAQGASWPVQRRLGEVETRRHSQRCPVVWGHCTEESPRCLGTVTCVQDLLWRYLSLVPCPVFWSVLNTEQVVVYYSERLFACRRGNIWEPHKLTTNRSRQPLPRWISETFIIAIPYVWFWNY